MAVKSDATVKITCVCVGPVIVNLAMRGDLIDKSLG